MALLMREAIGESLRRVRTARRRTLRDVSRRARVSLGYLSEVERGRKEPSSELLAAICEALDISIADLLLETVEAMAEPVMTPVLEKAQRRPIGLRHMELRFASAEESADVLPMSPPMTPIAPVAPVAPTAPSRPVARVSVAA
jgi:transcriptional regulator with XRE-family HTH domain